MKNVMYKIIVGCYIVAVLVLVCACNDGLDIQQAYPFTVETLPVPKKLKVGETAEIRCQLVRSGRYQPTTYQIRGGDAARTQETESRGNRRNTLPVGAERSLPADHLPDTLFPA